MDGIQLSLRPGKQANQLLAKLNEARIEGGTGELISGYYNAGEQKVYLSIPGYPLEQSAEFNIFKNAEPLDPHKNYRFRIRKSALAKFAKAVVYGGGAATDDLLEYDQAYLDELNKKSLSALKAAIASSWAGDFMWALLSMPLALGEKLAQGTVHAGAMSSLNLSMTILFPICLGPLVAYVNYRAQIADYKAKYGVSPPPQMLRKIKQQSIALGFQVSCGMGGWMLAYEFAEPLMNYLLGTTLASTPAYWVTVLMIGLLTALFSVLAVMIAQHFLKKNKTADQKEINYLWLGTLTFVTGVLFILCFSLPTQIGLKGFLVETLGVEWSKILCGLTSSVLIGSSVTCVSACYRFQDNLKGFNDDPSTHWATIKGVFGGDPQPDNGPRLAC